MKPTQRHFEEPDTHLLGTPGPQYSLLPMLEGIDECRRHK